MKRAGAAVGRWAGWPALLLVGLSIVPPAVQPADGGEFQLVARDLGVAHPPGYALYTLAAHLFGRLVLAIPYLAPGGWPWAVNAFSMVLAVATLAVVARTAARLGGSGWAGAVAALVLAASPTFAAQALVANIRMATALLAAVLVGCVAAWLDDDRDAARGILTSRVDDDARVTVRPAVGAGGREGGGDRTLVALAFTLALAAGHHPTLAALGLPLGLAVALRRPAILRDARRLATCAAAFAVGLLPLAYLPLRAAQGAPLAPSDLATAGGVWRHVTAAGFRGDMLALTGATDVADRLGVLANILGLQFALPSLVLAAVGAAWLVARRRAEAVAVGGTFVVVAWLAMTYRAPQTMEYLLPAYVALALAAGCGAAAVLDVTFGRHRRAPRAAASRDAVGAADVARVAAALAVVAAVAVRVPRAAAARGAVPDLAALLAVAADPDCVPASATVLASWHYAPPLWLAGRRSDVVGDAVPEAPYVTPTGAPIVYVHPDFATGDPIGLTWRKAAEGAGAVGPVVLTNRTPELNDASLWLEPIPDSPWSLVPGPSGRARDCRVDRYERQAFEATFDDEAGLGWSVRDVATTWRGDALVVTFLVAASPGATADGVVAFAQLGPAAGGPVEGQVDRPIGPLVEGPTAGTARVTLPLHAYRGLEGPPERALTIGLYRAGPDGPRRFPVRLPIEGLAEAVDDGTAVRFPSAAAAALAELAAHATVRSRDAALPFGNAMSLVTTRVRRTPTALVVDLTWRADARAFASDYTVSVQAAAADGAWRAQHDGTPALGAIPTLKWLPGMVIRDRHRLPLPPEAAGHDGPFTVTVGVYDAFSLEPLPVTDAARVRAGEGQRATVYPSP